jgi:hypothetical protein
MIRYTLSLTKRPNILVFLVQYLSIEISTWVGSGIVINNILGWQGLPGKNALTYLV